jgi:hypothetical protein
MKSHVDSTGQVALYYYIYERYWYRNMAKIEDRLSSKIDSIFPKDRYTVVMTGKALILKRDKIC